MTNFSEYFFKADDDQIVNISEIEFIDTEYVEKLELTVYLKNRLPISVSGLNAIDLIMLIKPSMIEGRRLKFPKNKWIVHNIIAHPLMQIMALLGFKKQAIKLHDATVPRPIGIK